MSKIQSSIIKCLVVILTTFTMDVESADLKVIIDQINSDNGTILAQLYSGEENYKNGKALKNHMLQAKKGKGKLLFKDLSEGEYVVRMFHDENDNQQMDTNAFGLPLEGYAFSNEAIGHMGPPKYSDMIVVITKTDGVIETKAKMIYL